MVKESIQESNADSVDQYIILNLFDRKQNLKGKTILKASNCIMQMIPIIY